MSRLIYVARVELNEKQVEVLAGPDSTKDAAAVQAIAQDLVTKMANGGFMLTGNDRQRIEKVIGPIKDGMDIVKVVEEDHGREGDAVKLSIILDPIWTRELEEKAEVEGRDMEELVSDLFSQAIHMGMFYDMTTDRTPVFFDREQAIAVRKRLGQNSKINLTGYQIATFCGWRPPLQAVDDPFAEKKEPVGA